MKLVYDPPSNPPVAVPLAEPQACTTFETGTLTPSAPRAVSHNAILLVSTVVFMPRLNVAQHMMVLDVMAAARAVLGSRPR